MIEACPKCIGNPLVQTKLVEENETVQVKNGITIKSTNILYY